LLWASTLQIDYDLDKDLFSVATFVIQEHKLKSSVFDSILQMVQGFMLKKVLYLQNETVDIKSKLNNLDVYLDTGIILSVLGLKNDYENQAARKMLDLILKLGARPICNEHILCEVQGIIEKYKSNIGYKGSSGLTLEFFDANRYTEGMVEDFLMMVEDKLRGMSVSIEETVEINDRNVNYNELELSEAIKGIGYVKPEALLNDVKSITNIRRIRGSISSASLLRIETCKAVFVTGN